MITTRITENPSHWSLRERRYRIFAALVGTLIIALSGCALFKKDLVDAGVIQLEEAPSEVVKISRVHIYMDGQDLVVYGRLGRKPRVNGRIEATVRVIVRFPEGRTEEKTTKGFPSNIPIRRSRSSYFNVRFERQPPVGTVIRIECPSMIEERTRTSLSLTHF